MTCEDLAFMDVSFPSLKKLIEACDAFEMELETNLVSALCLVSFLEEINRSKQPLKAIVDDHKRVDKQSRNKVLQF